MTAALWHTLVRMYWPSTPWIRSEQDVEIAEAEIRQAMGSSAPSNDELCNVVRWMAGPSCDQTRAPSLKQMVMYVHRYRRGGGDDGEVAKPAGCGLCGGDTVAGWLYPNTDLHPGHVAGVPCTCEAGRSVMDTCEPYKSMDADQKADIESLSRYAEQAVRAGGRMHWTGNDGGG